MNIAAKLFAGIFATIGTLAIVIGIMLTLNSQPATADDMLSLGERYLLEMQFEQALVQFLGVIEIEPMNVRAYLGAAEAFIGLGQQEAAINILRLGYERTRDEAIRQMLMELEQPDPLQRLIDELIPIIDALDIPFVVDNIWLGISDIGEVVAAYSDHPLTTYYWDYRHAGGNAGVSAFHESTYPHSREGPWVDTVVFFINSYGNQDVVYSVLIRDPSFLISASLRIGDIGTNVLRLFGLLEIEFPMNFDEPFRFFIHTPGGRGFGFESFSPGHLTDFIIWYWADGITFNAYVSNGYLTTVSMKVEAIPSFFLNPMEDLFDSEDDSSAESHSQENNYESTAGETEPAFGAEQNSVVVPNLLGLSEVEARKVLDEIGLILLVTIPRVMAGCPANCLGFEIVFDQTPTGGTQLVFPSSNRSVRVYICGVRK